MNTDNKNSRLIPVSPWFFPLALIMPCLTDNAGTVDPVVFRSVIRTTCGFYVSVAEIGDSSMNMDSSLLL
jgi:hypothetical protein